MTAVIENSNVLCEFEATSVNNQFALIFLVKSSNAVFADRVHHHFKIPKAIKSCIRRRDRSFFTKLLLLISNKLYDTHEDYFSRLIRNWVAINT